MPKQFSQDSFSQFSSEQSGYLSDESKPQIWQRALPVIVVVCVGMLAYYWGASAGTRMAGQIQELDLKTPAPAVKREVIGNNEPEIMFPQTKLPPVTTIVAEKKQQVASKIHKVAPQPQPTPVYDPFKDSSIPFRPAEDYPPGVEQSIAQPSLVQPSEQNSTIQNSTIKEEITAKTAQPKTAPLPIAEDTMPKP